MPFDIAVGCNIRKSPYFDATVADGVRSFSVYNHMYAPSQFGDPEAEYRALTTNVVLWDVSCERQVQLAGPDAERLARYLTTRAINGMAVGQGKYVPLCNYEGNLINDPVLLKLADDRFWLSIADSDILLWAQAIAVERRLNVQVTEPDASPLAVQGPQAENVVAGLFGDWVRQLKYFWFRETELDGIPILLARSGWSKQGGFELYLRDARRGSDLYWRVKEAGAPYGIVSSAPSDVERVESGLLSYGADARYGVNPFEAGLGAYVDLERADEFVGQAALRKIRESGVRRRRVGYVIGGDRIRGITEWRDVLLDREVVGTVTEAVFSPRLMKNIAVGLLSTGIPDDVAGLEVSLGDGRRPARIASLPFVPR
jgi:glycine cleavage system aminomethyltransferase T